MIKIPRRVVEQVVLTFLNVDEIRSLLLSGAMICTKNLTFDQIEDQISILLPELFKQSISFHLKTASSYDLPSDKIEDYLECLSNVPSLRYISVHSSFESPFFFDYVGEFKQVQHVSLHNVVPFSLTPFMNCHSLTSFKYKCMSNPELIPDSIFSTIIKNNAGLVSLEFDTFSPVSRHEALQICDAIKQLSHLTSLWFSPFVVMKQKNDDSDDDESDDESEKESDDESEKESIQDKNLAELIDAMLNSIRVHTNLEDLKLSYLLLESENASFASCIRQLKKLKRLTIDQCKYSFEDAQELPEAFAELTNLESLCLKVDHVDTQFWIAAGQSLPKLTKLTSLELSGCASPDLGLNIKFLTKLQHLSLSHFSITLGEVEKLVQSFIHIPQLKSFKFFGVSLSPQSFQKLLQGVSKFKNLQSLKLMLPVGDYVREEIRALSPKIWKLLNANQQLKEIHIASQNSAVH